MGKRQQVDRAVHSLRIFLKRLRRHCVLVAVHWNAVPGTHFPIYCLQFYLHDYHEVHLAHACLVRRGLLGARHRGVRRLEVLAGLQVPRSVDGGRSA